MPTCRETNEMFKKMKDSMSYDGVRAVPEHPRPNCTTWIIMGPDKVYWAYPLSARDKIRWHEIKIQNATINNMIAIVADVCFKHQGLHDPQQIKDDIYKRILAYKEANRL